MLQTGVIIAISVAVTYKVQQRIYLRQLEKLQETIRSGVMEISMEAYHRGVKDGRRLQKTESVRKAMMN